MRTLLGYGLVALTLSSSALGCGSDPPAKDPSATQLNQAPATNPPPQVATEPHADHAATMPGANPMPKDPSLAVGTAQPMSEKDKVLAKSEKAMSDAEIIGVVMVVNDGEVQMAEQAIKKAKNADAKSFATMMKTHHTQGLTKTKTVETKTKIAKADSDLTTFLKGDVEKTLKDLATKEGKDFDKGYMEAQVTAHKAVLSAIDNRLMPGAQNSEVKALVTETRKTVTDHIAKAEDIVKKLDAVAANDLDLDHRETKASVTTRSKAKSEKGVEPRP